MIRLMDLPYSYQELEPYISRVTVDVHYNKHHQGYVDKLNKLLELSKMENIDNLVFMIKQIEDFPFSLRDDILYNAMAVDNHNLYWYSMSSKHIMPSGKLEEQINKRYGSYENFQKEFKKVANSLTGSGYTFLVSDKKGELNIMNMSNQDSPYLYDYVPLLNLDLWEHSYYLDYLNERSNYINNFFSIIDFNFANKRYAETQSK